MSMSYNRGVLVGALAEDAETIKGNMVKLTVHCAKYVRNVGESYTEPMAVYVRPYTKGQNKDKALDTRPFTKGKPVFIEYSLVASPSGNAMPVVMPSNCHLCYPCIQDGASSHRTAEEDLEPEVGGSDDIPF